MTLIDAPRRARWSITLGYLLLRLTRDRVGLRLVARGHCRSRVFHIPVTWETFEEFARWSRSR